MPVIACDVKVLEHQRLTDTIRLMTVSWPRRDKAPKAGQFFMLRCWPADVAPVLSRPISVHSYDPELATLDFLYEVRGKGTEKLAALVPGDTLSLVGPAGNGFNVAEAAGKRVALVGGGIGTAPLYQLAKELCEAGTKADYFCGFRDEPYGMDRFTQVCGKVQLATDSGRFGFHGFVTQLLKPEEYDLVLCCGPDPMMRAVAKLCDAAGTRCIVSLERKMACGIGACLGCTCHTETGGRCVCKEGPVFDSKEVFGA